jgi:hypothetical protein
LEVTVQSDIIWKFYPSFFYSARNIIYLFRCTICNHGIPKPGRSMQQGEKMAWPTPRLDIYLYSRNKKITEIILILEGLIGRQEQVRNRIPLPSMPNQTSKGMMMGMLGAHPIELFCVSVLQIPPPVLSGRDGQ